MTSFSAEWLSLREPADRAARDGPALPLARSLVGGWPHAGALRVLDLGAGTGSNLRYMMDRVSDSHERQQWWLVDHDVTLLTHGLAMTSSWGRSRGYVIASDAPEPWELVMEREGHRCLVGVQALDIRLVDTLAELVPEDGLVTASALLDLVSDDWLSRIGAMCRKRGAGVLFALTYDGRLRCLPPEPEDPVIQELVNRHQRIDKGFGRALGPEATACAEQRLTQLGYQVEREASDWTLSSDSSVLQRQLVEGWAGAAIQMEPSMETTIRSWRDRRLTHVAGGRSQIIVGHQDLAGRLG